MIIRDLAHADHGIAAQIHLLMSIPEIAETIALSLLGELPDKCARQFAVFAGLNPSIITSAASVKRKEKISKISNKLLCKILFWPSKGVQAL